MSLTRKTSQECNFGGMLRIPPKLHPKLSVVTYPASASILSAHSGSSNMCLKSGFSCSISRIIARSTMIPRRSSVSDPPSRPRLPSDRPVLPGDLMTPARPVRPAPRTGGPGRRYCRSWRAQSERKRRDTSNAARSGAGFNWRYNPAPRSPGRGSPFRGRSTSSATCRGRSAPAAAPAPTTSRRGW